MYVKKMFRRWRSGALLCITLALLNSAQALDLDQIFEALKGDGSKNAEVLGVAKTGLKVFSSQVGPADEFFLGREAAARLIDDDQVLPFEHPASRYVHQIGTTLQLASHIPYTYRPHAFIVVDKPGVNAFAAPGGIVLIYRGVLDFVQDEDQLAAILAHEIGHLEREHGVRAVGRQKVFKLIGMMADLAQKRALGDKDPELQRRVDKLLDVVMGKLTERIKNGYSVEMESEADQSGADLLHKAGYDPYALYELIERFKSFSGSYGGAGYPEDRGALIRTHLKAMGITQAQARPEARQARFLRLMANLSSE